MRFACLFIRSLTVLVGGLILSAPVRAATIHVDAANHADPQQNGSIEHPFDTIREGINLAQTGDEVVIMPGAYTGPDNRDLSPGGKAIVMRSTDPTDPAIVAGTVIDCQNAGRGFSFTSNEGPDCRVLGLTITNGLAFYGGGVYCAQSSPTLMHCRIIANTASGAGGGIHCYYSSPKIEDCIIVANHAADHGGGIDCFYRSNPVISRCGIGDNTAQYSGGGIYCYVSNPLVVNCLVAGNVSAGGGGGMYCYYNSNASVVNSELVVNTTAGDGGGIGSTASFPTLTNCTITGNQAGGSGGGLRCAGGAITVANTIVWGNGAASGPQASVGPGRAAGQLTISYADVEGGQSAVAVEQGCALIWGGGNIETEPRFADPGGPDGNPGSWLDNDYGLRAGSPCIDAGNNAAVPPDTADLDGDGDMTEPVPFDAKGAFRRIDDAATGDTGSGTPPIVDIGAREYEPAVGDSDGDGVPDDSDACPNTVPGAVVDAAGCPPVIGPDFDRDGDVDEDDLSAFRLCALAAMRPAAPACVDKDLDGDNDVDQSDFGVLQACLSGRDIPADERCDDGVVPRHLVSLVVTGPDCLTSGGTAQYAAVATYSDGSTEDVTPSDQTAWLVVTGPGSIVGGLYAAPAGTAGLSAMLRAVFEKGGITKEASRQVAIMANTAPVAGPQPRSNTVQDTPVQISLIGSDEDTGNELTFVVVSLPAHGTLTDPGAPEAAVGPGYTLVAHGSRLAFTPEAGWSGSTSFEFRVSDGMDDSSVAVCPITVHLPAVLQQNDPWTPVTLASTQENPSGPQRLVITSLPVHGALKDPREPDDGVDDHILVEGDLPYTWSSTGTEVLYRPAPDYAGSDFFGYYTMDDTAQ